MRRRSARIALQRSGAVLWTAFLLCGTEAVAQEPPAPQPPAQGSAAEIPDQFGTAQLVWSTLIALDNANRTGNYSVLRDLGGSSFREANDPARLAEIFRDLRQQNLGLGQTVLLVPIYDGPPARDENGRIRIVGNFATRPVGIRFDLEFEFWNGAWTIYNIGVGSYNPMMPSENSSEADEQGQ